MRRHADGQFTRDEPVDGLPAVPISFLRDPRGLDPAPFGQIDNMSAIRFHRRHDEHRHFLREATVKKTAAFSLSATSPRNCKYM